jgi:hypothetical protein
MNCPKNRLLAWWFALCEARAEIDDYTDDDAAQGIEHLMRALNPLVIPSHGRVETTRITLSRPVQDLIRYGYLFPEDMAEPQGLLTKEARYSEESLLLSPKGLRVCTAHIQAVLRKRHG